MGWARPILSSSFVPVPERFESLLLGPLWDMEESEAVRRSFVSELHGEWAECVYECISLVPPGEEVR